MTNAISVFARLGERLQTPYSPYSALPKDMAPAMEQLAKLPYPITSKADLVDKLGGPKTEIEIMGGRVSASVMAMFIPAALFPFATIENLAEKLSELLAQREYSSKRRRPLTENELQYISKEFISNNAMLVEAVFRFAREWISLLDEQKVSPVELAKRLISDNPTLLSGLAQALRRGPTKP